MLRFFRKAQTVILGIRGRYWLIPMAGLGLALTGFSSGLANSTPSVDQSLMKLEQVQARLEATPLLAKQVSEAASADGVNKVADLEPHLQRAAVSSFDAAAIGQGIEAALDQTDGSNIDPKSFATAAQALTEAMEKLAKNDAAAAEFQALLADDKDGPRIAALTEAMASPDLAAETALTGQVMYSALEALTNSTAEQLSAASPDILQTQMQVIVGQLRDKSSNEKPVPKDVAAAQEKNHLSLVLASLPKDDLAVLAAFYASETGKAKRNALISAYRKASDASNTKLLHTYFQAVVADLKSNPPAQQN